MKIKLVLGSIAALATFILSTSPVLAAEYCFCKYPTDPLFGDCSGKDVHIGNKLDCAAACEDGPFIGGTSYNDYNAEGTPCDWQFKSTCLGPNVAQTSKKCKAEQSTWKSTAAVEQAKAASTIGQGSVVGLTLPSSDISLQRVIGRVIRGTLGVIGSIAFLMFVYAGFTLLIAQGDAKKVTTAKQTMLWASLGIVVIFGAYAIVSSILNTLTGA